MDWSQLWAGQSQAPVRTRSVPVEEIQSTAYALRYHNHQRQLMDTIQDRSHRRSASTGDVLGETDETVPGGYDLRPRRCVVNDVLSVIWVMSVAL